MHFFFYSFDHCHISISDNIMCVLLTMHVLLEGIGQPRIASVGVDLTETIKTVKFNKRVRHQLTFMRLS